MDFSPDGQWIASASDDFTVKLWSATDGALRRTFRGHENDVQSVAFSPDGSELYSGGKDFTVRVWGVNDGSEWRSYQDSPLGGDWRVDPRHLMVLSSDGQLLATGHSYLKWNPDQSASVLRLRQMPGGRLRNELRLEAALNSMAFSPDGQWLVLGQGPRWDVSAASRSYLALWKVQGEGDLIMFPGQTNSVEAVCFSPRDPLIACADYFGRINLWNLTNQTLVGQIPAATRLIRSLSFSPEGQHLAAASFDASLSLWRVPSGQLVWRTNLNSRMRAVAFSPDGRFLVAGSKDDKLGLHSVANGQRLRVLTGSAAAIERLVFSPDESWLASWAGGTDDNKARIWRVADGSLVWMTNLDIPTGLAFFPDSSALVARAAVSSQVNLAVINLPEGDIRYRLPGSNSWSLAVSPDGALLAEGTWDWRIRIWRLEDKTLLRTLHNYHGTITTLVFAPDSRHLFSASDDGTIKLWRMADGALLSTLQGRFPNLSADGSILVSIPATGASLDFWRYPGLVLDHALESLFAGSMILEVTPDHRYAILREGGTLRWRPLQDGLPIIYDQETSDVTALAVSPSGRYFACGRRDANIFLARNPLGSWDAPQTPPRMLLAPREGTAPAGSDFCLSARVAGAWPIRYQWLQNNQPVSGATNSVLSLHSVQITDGGSYHLLASNAYGSVTSPPAMLLVTTPPQIPSNSPPDFTTPVGSPVKLNVLAVGEGPLSYQWFFNEHPIPGETNSYFGLETTQLGHSGYYSVRVAQPGGQRQSRSAYLDVQFPLQPVASARHPYQPGAIAFSANQLLQIQALQSVEHNGDWLGFRVWIYSWSVDENRLSRISRFGGPNAMQSVLSGDGRILACSSNYLSMFFWDVVTNEILETSSTGPMEVMALSPDGLLLAWSHSFFLGVSATQPYAPLWTHQESSLLPSAMAFSPDSQLLAVLNQAGAITLWQVATGKAIRSWLSRDGLPNSLRSAPGHGSLLFSPDGAILISTSEDRRIRLWRVKDGSLVTALTGDFSEVQSMTVSQDGVILCVMRNGGYTVECWEIATGRKFPLQTAGNPVVHAAFSPDSLWLALAYADGQVILVDNPFIYLSRPARLALRALPESHSLQIGLQGGVGYQYSIQASVDLRHWINLTNFISLHPTHYLVDPETNQWSMRFYRSVELK